MNTKVKKKKSIVPFRLHILFFIVFVLFFILILRLGIVQIVYGDDFKREVSQTEDILVKTPVPRGKIFDRNGKIIVDNKPVNAITYTKYQHTKQEEIIDVAEKLSVMIVKDTPEDLKKIPKREKKDFWIMKHPDEAAKKITDKEKKLYKEKKLSDKELYKLQVNRITETDLNNLTKQDLEVLAIYREMNKGYAQSPQIIKNKNVTPEEYAVVSENLDNIPGVDTTTDWERNYKYDKTLKTILGNVTSSNEGLPKEMLDYYTALGYSRNDRVGKSYLELQYEDILRGQNARVRNKTDKSGNVISTEVVSEGARGKDLVLTIDMDLQVEVEKIIEKYIKEAANSSQSYLMDRAFVVLMDPATGEILTMAGKQVVKDPSTGKKNIQDYALGTFTSAYNVGSAVKGATILTGYKTEAIKPGDTFIDAPMVIKDTPEKSSWKNFGRINDLRALQVSSNVYMFNTAIKIGKGSYVPNQPLRISIGAFDIIRKSYGQFGLGVRTGIDLPNESTGFPGSKVSGKLLDLVIGQYDTYTAMQLAQYVSTIANGGYRVQPHIVKEIRNPGLENNQLGPVFQKMEPKILNTVDAKEEWVNRVKEGFRRVMQVGDGTGVRMFGSTPYDPAGKTGTAEAFYDGPDRKKLTKPGQAPPSTINLSLVSYAPSSNPEIAMSVIVPWAYQGNSGPSYNNMIGREVLDLYFGITKQKDKKPS